MRKHLYKKKHCPKTTENAIELTDEIKDHILQNRIYRPPVQQPTIINKQIVNNYNQINNFIHNVMGFEEKINHLMTFKQSELLDFDDKVFQCLANKSDEYNKNEASEYLSTLDLMEIINTVCESTDEKSTDLNVYYDKLRDKIQIREDGDWISLLRDKGSAKILSTIQHELLNTYKAFLIRKCETDKYMQERARATEKLKEYYTFISCFNLVPLVKDTSDDDIMNNGKMRSYSMSEKYMDIFCKVKNNLTISQMNKTKADVWSIVKRSTKKNIEDLNTKLMDLMRIDPDFKQVVVEKIRTHTTLLMES